MNSRKLVDPKFLAISLLLLTTLIGCGGDAGVVPVKGRVALDGKPFENVQVLFYVPGGGPETNYTAITDAEGQFTLTSLDGQQSGVAPGTYSVTLTTAHWAPDALETDPPPRERVAPQHREHQFEVPTDGTDAANFELSSQ